MTRYNCTVFAILFTCIYYSICIYMYIHVYSICALRAHCAHALAGPLKFSLLRAWLLPAKRTHCRIILSVRHVWGFEVRINIALTVTASLRSRPSVNFKGKDCVSYVSEHLAGTDRRMENSCKRRAYCLYRSFVIIHTQRDQWQASLKYWIL